MRSPPRKNLDVYEFQDGDEVEEIDKAELKHLMRFREKYRHNYRSDDSSPLEKEKFLEVFSKDGNVGTMDSADVICLDSDERKPQREVSFHTSEVDPLRGMHMSSEEEEEEGEGGEGGEEGEGGEGEGEEGEGGEGGEGEESPVTLRSTDNNLQSDECEEDTSIECINRGLGDELHLEQCCPFSDYDINEQTVSSSCHSPNESDGSFGHQDTMESQNGYESLEDADMIVTILPDCIFCGDRTYSESKLIFSPECIKIKCLDAHGTDSIISEWATENLINIDCLCIQSVETALIKIQLKIINDTGSSEGFVILNFTVYGPQWSCKEHKIKSLAPKYKDVWKVESSVGKALYLDDSVRANPFFTSNYLRDFSETFEDVVFPEGDPDAVSVSRKDMELLQPETFINDTVIDFYIKYLKNKLTPDVSSRCHFFNSFFFRKLADMDKDPQSHLEGRAAFLRVRKWTRKVNLFQKDYLFIPVNFNLHWSLLVICHPGEIVDFKEKSIYQSSKVPCILHMDSLRGTHAGLESLMQSYLWEEWKERNTGSSFDIASRFSNLNFISLELPQQANMFDCGVFLLHYVELFLKDAPVNFNPFDITIHSNFLNPDWFVPAEASYKRFLIRNLLYDLLHHASQDDSLNNDLSKIRNHGLEREPTTELASSNGLALNTGLAETPISAVREIQQKSWTSSSVVSCPKEGEITDQQLVLAKMTSGSSIDKDGFVFHRLTTLKNHKYVLSPIIEEVAEQSSFLDSEKGVPQAIPMDIGMPDISDNFNDDTVLDTPTDGSGNSSKARSSQIDEVVFNNPPSSHTSILEEADNPISSDVSICKEIFDKRIVEDSQEIDTSMNLCCDVNDPSFSLGEKHKDNSLTAHSDNFLETYIVEDSQEEMEQIQVIRQSISADQKFTDGVRDNPDICMVDEDKDSQKVEVNEGPLHSSQENGKSDHKHKQSLISSSKDGIGICNVVSLDDEDDLQIFSDDTISKRQKLEHTKIQRIQRRSTRTPGMK